jgi:hypothetical protein
MGGNALKNCTRRYQSKEYHDLAKRLKDFISSELGVLSVVIPAYENKDSFGDIDILVMSDLLPSNWKDKLKQKLNLAKDEYQDNGNCFSIKFEEIQADLIIIKEENFQSSLFYFSYNDLGNLLGRIAHINGVKFGHNGLSLTVRPRENMLDHVIGEIEITKDPKTILGILGLDIKNYGKFFDIEDIFEFVASSKYFNPDIFLLENRNCESRIRDKKRKTYMLFLDWCEKNKDRLNRAKYPSKDGRYGYHIKDEFYKEVILSRFPDIKTKVDSMIDDFELNREFRKVFNGDIVSKLTGLNGKDLGMFMRSLVHILEPKELFIAHPEYVERVIKEEFEKKNA